MSLTYEGFTSSLDVLSSYFKLGIEQPNLSKSEELVGNDLQTHLIDLSCPLEVLCDTLLVHSVVNPKVNVAPPVLLFLQQFQL